MKHTGFLMSAAALLVVAASGSVEAGWGSSGYGSYGSSGHASYGSYGSSGGSSGYVASYGGSHGSSGGGLFSRLRAHFAAKRAAHGSSGFSSHGSSGYASYGSHGSSGYASYGSHGSSGHVSYGSHGSTGHVSYSAPVASSGSVSYAAPTVHYTPTHSDFEGAAHRSRGAGRVSGEATVDPLYTSTSIDSDAVLITVAVPADAKVTVNGHETSSEGPIRQFMSRGLKSGFTYSYLVAAETVVDGQPIVETKTVKVRAGDKERLVFDSKASSGVETALTLRVPEDAKVTLAGNPTAAKGEVRTFRTKQLNAGETWSGYEIEVSIQRDGQRITKRETLDLVAGSTPEFSFEFDSAETTLAAR